MNPRSFSVLPALTLAVTVAFTAHAPATEIRVDHTGGGDYLTIQEGVDAASEADTVWVAEGTYTGDLNRDVDFGDKNLVVRSELGTNLTTIDCQDLGRAFYLSGGQDGTTIIRGFTVMNGSSASGGAVYLFNSSATIVNCRFLYCTATAGSGFGGAVFCQGDSSPSITNSQFVENDATYGGALGTKAGGSAALDGVAFIDNIAYERGGGWYCEQPSSRATISNCSFIRNVVMYGVGGGAYLYEAPGTITNSTFSENSGSQVGGIFCYSSSPVISNTIVAFSGVGKGIGCGGGGDPTITHCAIYGNEAGDDLCGSPGENIFVDPRFCDMGDNNLTLCANSVCLPENNAWNEQVGDHGEGCVACDSPVEATTWGAIKGLYR